jgi:uncharacterized membrane protein
MFFSFLFFTLLSYTTSAHFLIPQIWIVLGSLFISVIIVVVIIIIVKACCITWQLQDHLSYFFICCTVVLWMDTEVLWLH